MKQTLLLLMLLGITLSSCSTSALLRSTFESETVGTVPNTNIPGAPEGDQITYSRELRPRISVVASTRAGEKALDFNTASAPGLTAHNQWLGFAGTSTNLTEPVYFYYTATQMGAFNRLTVDATDGTGKVMARMILLGSGEVRLVSNLGTSTSTLEGTIPPEAQHTVVLAVNVRESTYTLTVFKSGGAITSGPKRLLLDDPLAYSNPSRPTLSFRFDDSEFSGNRYVFEEVFISKKRPSP